MVLATDTDDAMTAGTEVVRFDAIVTAFDLPRLSFDFDGDQ